LLENLSFRMTDVSVAFRQGDRVQTVLSGATVEIGKGEWLGVVGRVGSGKSTLLRVLAGLLPVSKGNLDYGWAKGVNIGVVLQNPEAQIVGETVGEDLIFGMETAAVDPVEMQDRARKVLADVGLQGFEERMVDRLSGGQKQLVAVAGCLASGAPVVVFDEATSMLDPQSREMVLRAVQRLHREGMTVIWATQRLEELAYADRVLALEEGKTVFAGTPRSFFYGTMDGNRTVSAERVDSPCERLGFAAPYIVQVSREMLSLGVPLRELPLSMEEWEAALPQSTR
jgi:energy-coupling factor transport system ATP-binding protein